MNRSKFVILLAVFLACLAPKRVCAQIGPKRVTGLEKLWEKYSGNVKHVFLSDFFKKTVLLESERKLAVSKTLPVYYN